jgi:pimeloyl-ACP methyl ester carboxylesterase
MSHPECIAGLIFQNTTLSVEGWKADHLQHYERISGPETPEKVADAEQLITVERDMVLHRSGARWPDDLDPTDWAVDSYVFSQPEKRLFMARLVMQLSSNVPLYPAWNAYLRKQQPKGLIVWGRNDTIMEPVGAENIKRELPQADLRFFGGGHFVLDENSEAVAQAIKETFCSTDRSVSRSEAAAVGSA